MSEPELSDQTNFEDGVGFGIALTLVLEMAIIGVYYVLMEVML